MVDAHDQPGDPKKAGKLIVETVNSGVMPKRLALGSDAVRIIETEYADRLSELKMWSEISRKTDYDAEENE